MRGRLEKNCVHILAGKYANLSKIFRDKKSTFALSDSTMKQRRPERSKKGALKRDEINIAPAPDSHSMTSENDLQDTAFENDPDSLIY